MDDGWKKFMGELVEYMRVNDKRCFGRITEMFKNDEDPVLLVVALGHARIVYIETGSIAEACKTLKEYFTEC